MADAPQVIQVAKGAGGQTVRFLVKAPSENGAEVPAAGQLDGTETLTCQVWPGSDREMVATLPAELVGPDDETPFDTDYPLVLVSFTPVALDDLEAGVYRARVLFADLSALLVEFAIELRDGPGTSTARPAYHTYKQLRDAMFFADRFNDHLHDETGFAEIAAAVRDRIDAAILVSAAGQVDCWYRRQNDFAAALDDGGIDLTTLTGRQVSQVSVLWTTAEILKRSVGMTNDPDNYREEAKEREAEGERLLRSLKITLSGYPTVNLGALRVGRLVR